MFVPKVMTIAGRHQQSTVPSIKIFLGLVLNSVAIKYFHQLYVTMLVLFVLS